MECNFLKGVNVKRRREIGGGKKGVRGGAKWIIELIFTNKKNQKVRFCDYYW